MIILRKLAEQQKEQRAEKTKNSFLKQTRDKKATENLSPITKKVDTITESTKNLGKFIKKPNLENFNIKALPNSSSFSDSMRKMIGSLMRSKNSLKNYSRGIT